MLDGGPSRMSPANDRRAAYRTANAQRQPQPQGQAPRQEEPRSPLDSVPQSAPRGRLAEVKESNLNRVKLALLLVMLVLALIVAGWLAWSSLRSDGAALIDSDRYQAVFLAGGQIYFGKLEFAGSDYMQLTDVFYVQPGAGQSGDDGESQPAMGNDLQLIKLGDEVHAPEDEMIINRDQVLFFENLKQDGRVVELIRNYRSGQN